MWETVWGLLCECYCVSTSVWACECECASMWVRVYERMRNFVRVCKWVKMCESVIECAWYWNCVCMLLSVCVCVRERERGERVFKTEWKNPSIYFWVPFSLFLTSSLQLLFKLFFHSRLQKCRKIFIHSIFETDIFQALDILMIQLGPYNKTQRRHIPQIVVSQMFYSFL